MVFELEDQRLRMTQRQVGPDRLRLTLDYPAEAWYRRAVLAALSELFRVSSKPDTEPGVEA